MRLDDVAERLGITIVRSQEFDHLGFFTDRRHRVLSPFFNRKFRAELVANPQIVMVLTTPQLAEEIPPERGLATATNPLQTFIKFHIFLHEQGSYWRSFKSRISPGARIHPRAYVADNDVEIGGGVIIGPNATVLERTIVGDECVIGPGVVLGCEGYEPRDLDGRRIIVPHAGGVRLGNRVQIQANSAVSRSLYGGFTEIGDETTTDNFVHIAHNVKIGRRCRLAAAAMIAGSTTVGDDVWIGPNSTISSSIKIGNRARVTLGAVVTQDVADDGHVSGNFAIEHKKLLKFIAGIR